MVRSRPDMRGATRTRRARCDTSARHARHAAVPAIAGVFSTTGGATVAPWCLAVPRAVSGPRRVESNRPPPAATPQRMSSSCGARARWRAATRWPASVARRSDTDAGSPVRATLEPARRGSPHRTRRRRRSCPTRTDGRVAMSDRIGVEPSPRARIDAPCGAALDDDDGREREQPLECPPAEQRLGLRRRSRTAGPARRSARRAWAAFCPAASNGPARGEIDADRRAVHPGELGRPSAGRTERLAQQRVGRQVQHVDAAEPGRLEVARATGRPRRRGRRRTSARHCRPCRSRT